MCEISETEIKRYTCRLDFRFDGRVRVTLGVLFRDTLNQYRSLRIL